MTANVPDKDERRVYLHVGTPKTGTSFLQNVLRRAELAGALEDTCYPITDHANVHAELGNAHDIAMHLKLQNDWDPVTTEEKIDIVLRRARQGSHVILSSEGLIFAQADRFEWLLDRLATRGFTPKVVCVVRDLAGWTSSHLSMAAGTGKILSEDGSLTPNFDLPPAQGVRNLARFATSISSPISFVEFRLQSLLSDFLSVAGESANLTSMVTQNDINRRMTLSEFRLIQMVRRHSPANSQIRKVANQLTAGPRTEETEILWPPFGDRALNMIREAIDRLSAEGHLDVVSYLNADAFIANQRQRQNELPEPLPMGLDIQSVERLVRILLQRPAGRRS
jgi:hypothetical protein